MYQWNICRCGGDSPRSLRRKLHRLLRLQRASDAGGGVGRYFCFAGGSGYNFLGATADFMGAVCRIYSPAAIADGRVSFDDAHRSWRAICSVGGYRCDNIDLVFKQEQLVFKENKTAYSSRYIRKEVKDELF